MCTLTSIKELPDHSEVGLGHSIVDCSVPFRIGHVYDDLLETWRHGTEDI